jgi:hypothetical protein
MSYNIIGAKNINFHCFLFLRLLRCFTSPGLLMQLTLHIITIYVIGFSHSEISGSKLASQLPEAFRRHATSFLASISQGIHHSLITYPLINSINELIKVCHLTLIPFCKDKGLRKFLNRYRFYVSYELYLYALFYLLIIKYKTPRLKT